MQIAAARVGFVITAVNIAW